MNPREFSMETFEIFLVIDADGDYEVGVDYDDATTRFDENVGGNGARRVIKLNVKASLPVEIEDGPTVVVPDSEPAVTESTYANG